MKMIKYIQLILLFLLPALLFSQTDINKEVRVVKAYEPAIQDADKLIRQPEIEDTSDFNPEVYYKISPQQVSTSFNVRPIKPAKMVGVPLNKLYKTYIKAGVGNYLTPMAEISINNLRSKDYSLSAYAFHKSSVAKLKLDNNKKTPAGYANNILKLDGKVYKNRHTFGSTLGASSNTIHFYGYNTDIFSDSVPDVEGKDIQQNYNYLHGDFYARSAHTDSTHLIYRANLHLGAFGDNYNNSQNNVFLDLGAHLLIDDILAGADIAFDSYNSTEYSDSLSNRFFTINPWVSMHSSDWYMKLGLKTVSDLINDKFYAYIDALAQFTVVQKVLLPYVGASGGLVSNDFYSLSLKNQFVTPGSHFRSTNNKINAFAGIKGSLNSKTSFNLKASFNIINDMVYFINDTSTVYQHTFTAEQEPNELTMGEYMGEVSYSLNEQVYFSGRINLFRYNVLSGSNKAWHLPKYKFAVNGFYNFKDKIAFNASLQGIGNRPVYDVENNKETELKPIFDLNLGADYQYNSLLTIFLQLNNLTNSRYEIWNQYPAQRLNVLIGATFNI